MSTNNRGNLKLWLAATLAIGSLSTATSLLFKNEEFTAKIGLVNTVQETFNKVAEAESSQLAAAVSLADLPVQTTEVNSWIAANFKNAPVLSDSYNGRTTVESPSFVKNASVTSGKYGFFIVEAKAPTDKRVAFVNVTIKDLVSSDVYGGGIGTSRGYPGESLFLSNVYIEPNWPTWIDYKTTNYDGMTLDATEAIYAENVTIKNWNADSAMDIKSNVAQLVNLKTVGNGNRTLRFWRPGPHYIVSSSINNNSGAVIWLYDCSNAKLYIYKSTFNGSATIPSDKLECDNGSNPQITYLTKDPRTTGEMHPMFSGNTTTIPDEPPVDDEPDEPEDPVTSSFKSGDKVATTDNLNVRITANGSVRGLATTGSVGTVGSQSPTSLAGYTWIYVSFTNGIAGWVADSFLKKYEETTPTPPQGNANPMLINAGDTSNFEDTNDRVWSADYGSVDGGTTNRGAIAIANTANDRLYQTERWGVTRYNIPVSSSGTYEVKLHFAETYSGITAAGQRVFSINAEGTAINNLDVYKEAGGRNRALVKTLSKVIVKDGSLTVSFTANKQNTMINAIEIKKISNDTTVDTPSADAEPLLIDSGNTATFTDGDDRVWSADYGADGSIVNRGAISIANTSDDGLYRTERWGLTKYNVPVTNGTYTVKLHFAETYSGITAAGKRVFSVNVEGKSLSNLDVYKEVGRNKALVKTFDDIEVSDGVLSITFTKVKENPMISGVEILVDSSNDSSDDDDDNDDNNTDNDDDDNTGSDDNDNDNDDTASDPSVSSFVACGSIEVNSSIKVRQSPSNTASSFASFNKGATGTVGTPSETTAEGINWIWLNFYNGRGGWVDKSKVTFKDTVGVNKSVSKYTSCQTVVASQLVYIREEASLSSNARTSIKSGIEGSIDPLNSVSADGHTWVYVNFYNGRNGWVEQDYLTTR